MNEVERDTEREQKLREKEGTGLLSSPGELQRRRENWTFLSQEKLPKTLSFMAALTTPKLERRDTENGDNAIIVVRLAC